MIKLTSEDGVYTLGFTKKTIVAMERSGFSLNKIDDYPQTYIPMFIHGAFRANHPSMKSEKMDEIWKHVENKEGLLEALIKNYGDQANALMDEPDVNDPKKASWEEV